MLPAWKKFLLRYPNAKVISTEKSIMMMYQFGFNVEGRTETVAEGDSRCFGKHTIAFVDAQMVHWPEAWLVMIPAMVFYFQLMPLEALKL